MEIWANTNTGYRVPQLGVYGLGLWSYRRVQRFSVKARGLRVNMGCRVFRVQSVPGESSRGFRPERLFDSS